MIKNCIKKIHLPLMFMWRVASCCFALELRYRPWLLRWTLKLRSWAEINWCKNCALCDYQLCWQLCTLDSNALCVHLTHCTIFTDPALGVEPVLVHYRAWCNDEVRTKKCDSSLNLNLTTFGHNREMNNVFKLPRGGGIQNALETSRLF